MLAHLLANGFRGKVKLIYIDPRFDSGADYVRKVSLRGAKGTAKIDGENYELGEQIQYTDIWANDNYLQFMYERLQLQNELLAPSGSIVLRCDSTKALHLRCLMDEIFGADKTFKNGIIWFYRRWPTNTPTFQAMHDNLFWYTKCNENSHGFNKLYEPASDRTLSDYGGKRLTTIKTEDGSSVKRETEETSLGVPLRDAWEIRREHPRGNEHTDYPAQKPAELLERLLLALSRPGDLVLDSFIGSGTTAAAAQRLGRRWIGCDINKGAIQTTFKRVQAIILEQIKTAGQGSLTLTDGSRVPNELAGEENPTPAQHAFTVWRVNDYDLAIQHNEAVNLACEHVGVERNRSDGFFDGTLGKALAKIIPFGHPLSPSDLDEVRRELDARPDEDRPARLRAKVTRRKNRLHVEIKDFISPRIIERLEQRAGIVKPKIDDWRAMVDCVMIDTAYNGTVFNVALSDIPERKTDFVNGHCDFPAPADKVVVAIKVIDMLGEEVLVTAEA